MSHITFNDFPYVFQLTMSLSTLPGRTSQLKVRFKNHKKILYARADLVSFDDIFNQIESSVPDKIVKNFSGSLCTTSLVSLS